jgi:hypothetical protein
MVDKATERIRDSLTPLITDVSQIKEDTVASYAIHIIDGVSEVRGLMYVMLKSDEGIFLRQLTDLIYNQVLTNSCSFFGINESKDLQLFYEFLSVGMAAFIIKLVLDKDVTEERAAALLTEILRQISITIPLQLGK